MLDSLCAEILNELENQAIIILNSENKIIYSNKYAEKIAGNIKITGSKINDVLPWVNNVLNGNHIKNNYIQLGRRGEKGCYKLNVKKITNDITIITVTNYTTIVNNRNRLKSLINTLRLYKNVLECLTDGIIVTDDKGNIVYINKAQEKIDNLERQMYINKNVKEVFNLDEQNSLILRALKTRKPVPEEHQYYINMRGQAVNIVTYAYPVFCNRNKLLGAVAICRDTIKAKEIAEKIVRFYKNSNEKKTYKKQKLKKEHYHFEDIVGNNPKLKKAIHWSKLAAKTDANILIYGPTGTGKELFAQSIHSESERSKGPFIAINCAALPETLLEGILFGTVKGAFTGAVDRPGLFEQARGGTIFLDELNSMPIGLQAKLLRVIQDGTLRRVGGIDEISVDLRIIASLNTEPELAIEKGLLRQDLFYRLAVVAIRIPALKERKDDIPQLVSHFIEKHKNRLGRSFINGVTKEVMECFFKYNWPGNVRELEHVIESALIVSGNKKYICLEHLPPRIVSSSYIDGSERKNSDFDNHNQLKNLVQTELQNNINYNMSEKELVIQTLQQTKGNISRAARILGMKRQCLQYRIKKYHIAKEKFK